MNPSWYLRVMICVIYMPFTYQLNFVRIPWGGGGGGVMSQWDLFHGSINLHPILGPDGSFMIKALDV